MSALLCKMTGRRNIVCGDIYSRGTTLPKEREKKLPASRYAFTGHIVRNFHHPDALSLGHTWHRCLKLERNYLIDPNAIYTNCRMNVVSKTKRMRSLELHKWKLHLRCGKARKKKTLINLTSTKAPYTCHLTHLYCSKHALLLGALNATTSRLRAVAQNNNAKWKGVIRLHSPTSSFHFIFLFQVLAYEFRFDNISVVHTRWMNYFEATIHQLPFFRATSFARSLRSA